MLCISQLHPLTDKHQRTFGIIDQLGSRLNTCRISIGYGNIATDKVHFSRNIFCLFDLRILGKVKHYRSGTTATGNIKSTCHCPRNIFGTANLITPFSDRLSNTHQVYFLKRIRSQKSSTYLSGNHYNRRTVNHRIGYPGDGIRRSGTTGDEADSHLPGRTGKALGCMCSPLLMTYQNMP